MSRYEWEKGDIIIPSSEWPTFRTTLIQSWNVAQLALYNVAQVTLKTIKALNKSKRNVDWNRAIWDYLLGYGYSEEDSSTVHKLIYKNGKLCSPVKKDLQIYPTTKDCSLGTSEVTITLNNKNRTVCYVVRENNHACDSARQLSIVKKLFSLLSNIKWTKGTGGVIIGNDEYNRDSESEGGGGNYTKMIYGKQL